MIRLPIMQVKSDIYSKYCSRQQMYEVQSLCYFFSLHVTVKIVSNVLLYSPCLDICLRDVVL